MVRNKKIEIDESHKEIARKFVALARRLGLREIEIKFKTDDDWDADIQAFWEAGRHGAPSQIKMTSQFWASAEENIKGEK